MLHNQTPIKKKNMAGKNKADVGDRGSVVQKQIKWKKMERTMKSNY